MFSAINLAPLPSQFGSVTFALPEETANEKLSYFNKPVVKGETLPKALLVIPFKDNISNVFMTRVHISEKRSNSPQSAQIPSNKNKPPARVLVKNPENLFYGLVPFKDVSIDLRSLNQREELQRFIAELSPELLKTMPLRHAANANAEIQSKEGYTPICLGSLEEIVSSFTEASSMFFKGEAGVAPRNFWAKALKMLTRIVTCNNLENFKNENHELSNEEQRIIERLQLLKRMYDSREGTARGLGRFFELSPNVYFKSEDLPFQLPKVISLFKNVEYD